MWEDSDRGYGQRVRQVQQRRFVIRFSRASPFRYRKGPWVRVLVTHADCGPATRRPPPDLVHIVVACRVSGDWHNRTRVPRRPKRRRRRRRSATTPATVAFVVVGEAVLRKQVSECRKCDKGTLCFSRAAAPAARVSSVQVFSD